MSENTRSPENAETWRDLTDQLTPEQIAELEESERNPYIIFELPGGNRRQTVEELRTSLLRKARSAARDNLAGMLYAEVPEPAGVTRLHRWDGDFDLRSFDGTRRPVEVNGKDLDGNDAVVSVDIWGTQHPDGHVERTIMVDGSLDDLLTLEQARRLGQALIEAADEAETMNANDKIVA
jgi:hypothetical protein